MAAGTTSNRHMRKAIRDIVEPALHAMGFDGDYPVFHRLTGTEWHGLAIRTDKYGGGFSIDMARGPFSRARYLRLRKTDPAQARLPDIADYDRRQRASLWHEDASGRWSGDFRYDTIRDDPDACRALASELAALLPEAGLWLGEGRIGPHVSANFADPPGRPDSQRSRTAARTVLRMLTGWPRRDKDGVYRP
ncbi:hypothetical protein [Croceicoccus sp. Ery5]|uniref:hypothetical protein n=1 Tax=Croceicoccus sp. Ery5 TaxID=1703340 RepID=UPI001E5D5041|nr:hypothetical protein [Croceicoccus sp. Ery5]